MNVTNEQLSHDPLDGSALLMTSPLSLAHMFEPPTQPEQQPLQPLQQQPQRYEHNPDVQRMINEHYVPPALIVRGVVSPDEVQQLFSMYVIPCLVAICPVKN